MLETAAAHARAISLIGVAMACGCETSPTPPVVTRPRSTIAPGLAAATSSPTAPVASSAQASPPDAGADVCAPFVAPAMAKLVSKIPSKDAYSPSAFASGICVPAKDGAWAIEYRDVVVNSLPPTSAYSGPETAITARWTLVRSYADGRRLSASEAHLEIGPYSASTARVEAAFDYDGDGEEEILLRTDHHGVGFNERRAALMTSRGGAIAPFGLAHAIDVDRLEDVDQDGRPDLVTVGPYEPEKAPMCASDQGDPAQSVYLLAHSTPAGFSFTDSVASEYAKRGCPRPPTKLDLNPNLDESLSAVRCARLWGVSAPEALRAIRAKCQRQASPAEGCAQPRAHECLRFDVLVAWASATPPVLLAP